MTTKKNRVSMIKLTRNQSSGNASLCKISSKSVKILKKRHMW